MVFEQIIDTTLSRRRERDQGVMSLFGDWDGERPARRATASPSASPIPDARVRQGRPAAVREGDARALRVSDHPLFGVEGALRRKVDCTDRRARRAGRRRPGRASAGVITSLARKFTKQGDQMAVFVLEDLDAAIEVTVFPRTLTEQGHKLVDDPSSP